VTGTSYILSSFVPEALVALSSCTFSVMGSRFVAEFPREDRIIYYLSEGPLHVFGRYLIIFLR
jgi:hypothetical protein